MHARVSATALIVLAALAAAPAMAQPIIIPLNKDSGNPRAAEPTAPPVAPPQAGPSMPQNLAGSSSQEPGQATEEASQPPAKP